MLVDSPWWLCLLPDEQRVVMIFRRLFVGIVWFLVLPSSGFAQTWNTSANNKDWGDSNNWNPTSVPNATGATATLGPTIPANRTINVNGNYTIGTLNIDSDKNYTLHNNKLIFDATSGDAKLNITNSGSPTINSAIQLDDPLALDHSGTGLLTLGGVISGGTNGLTKSGSGTVVFSGSGANTFTGATTVQGGELRLNKSSGNAIAGPLIIGNGSGTDVVRLMAANQIGDTNTVTVNSSGQFLFNGSYAETISSLDMTGGLVNTGSGTLTLTADPAIVTHAHTNAAEIKGHLILQGSKTIQVADGAAAVDLDISANIGDQWYTSITKTGDGTMRLSGSNSFQGPLTISNGVVIAAHNNALGTTNTWGNTVASGAALHLTGGISVVEGGLDLAGTGPDGAGALVSISGSNSFKGTVDATAATTLGAAAGASLTLDGSLSLSKDVTFSGVGNHRVLSTVYGSETLIKTGTGTLQFAGSNSISGKRLDVLEGTAELNRPGVTLNTSEGPTVGTTSGSAATLKLLTPNQIRDDHFVTVRESGTFDLNGNNEGVAGLKLYGGAVKTGAGTLSIVNAGGDEIHSYTSAQTATITGNLRSDLAQGITIKTDDGTPAVDLDISAAFSGSVSKVTKEGGGVLQFSGTNANTYTGQTLINDGTLILKKTAGVDAIAGSSITVNTGGTLRLDNDNQIKNSTSLILNGGTFLTGATTGHSEALNTLTLSSSSTIDLGTGAHQLVFADSSPISWVGTLMISNWAGVGGSSGTAGQIFFGVGGLTSTQLAQIQFEGFSPGARLLPSGELVPVPEVRGIAAILAVLAIILLKERERFTRMVKRGVALASSQW